MSTHELVVNGITFETELTFFLCLLADFASHHKFELTMINLMFYQYLMICQAKKHFKKVKM